MQRRNLKILILALVAILVVFFSYSYFFPQSKPAQIIEESVGPNFFPFNTNNKKTNTETPVDISNTGDEGTNNFENTNNDKKLKKVSSFPVAGYGIYAKEVFKELPPVETIPVPTVTEEPTTKNTKTKKEIKPIAPATEFVNTLRYVEKETGNIYQTDVEQIVERRYTNTVIPKIHEAFFGKNALSVVMRYLKDGDDTIQSFSGTLPTEILGGDSTQNTEIKGSFLPENITTMTTAPDHSKIFYLFNVNDSAIGVIAGILGDKKTQVFNSSYTEWLSQWPNDKEITLTTKASVTAPGYMYAFDPDKKVLNKVLGGISGLTTLTSPSGKDVLYNISKGGSVSLNIHNIDTGNSILLGIKTLPEKCVWTKSGSYLYCAIPKSMTTNDYPDAWYKGLVSFRDEIWKIDTQNGAANKIADPLAITGEEVDGTTLSLDDNEGYLFFINKKDSYLWELNLK